MGVYIKTANGIKRLDGGDSGASSVDLAKHESNHYVHLQEDNTGELNIVDDNGFVIAKIDADGFNAKNVKVDGIPVSRMIEVAIEGLEFSGNEEGGNGEALTHINNRNNPHGVNKDQIGLGKVDNTSDMEKPVSTAQQALFDNHSKNKENPHEVTKEQIGLDKVDNTSDKEKPISTLQQQALDNIVKELSEHITSETDEFHIVDKDGNIVATIDKNGINAVDIKINGEPVESLYTSKFVEKFAFTSRGGVERVGAEYASTASYAERSSACLHRIQVLGGEQNATSQYSGDGRGVLTIVDSRSTEHTIDSLKQLLLQYGATGSKSGSIYSTLYYPMTGVVVADDGDLTVPIYGLVVDGGVVYGVGFDYTKDVGYYFPVTSITDTVRSV